MKKAILVAIITVFSTHVYSAEQSADINRDGVVDCQDLAQIEAASYISLSSIQAAYFSSDEGHDLNGDGTVNSQDLGIFASADITNDGRVNAQDLGAFRVQHNRVRADMNRDGDIDGGDLNYLRSVFFTADPQADANCDGRVNVIDLGILRQAL